MIIGKLEDLLRIEFIHEECGNLKLFVDGRELTRNINEKKKPGVLQTYRCPLKTNVLYESISSISMWNIKNQ